MSWHSAWNTVDLGVAYPTCAACGAMLTCSLCAERSRARDETDRAIGRLFEPPPQQAGDQKQELTITCLGCGLIAVRPYAMDCPQCGKWGGARTSHPSSEVQMRWTDPKPTVRKRAEMPVELL